MGYQNDQHFNFNRQDITGESNGAFDPGDVHRNTSNIPADNPPFIYPARVARVINRDGSIDAIPLKRGYIRSLTTQAGLIAIPIKKCQFQFNPENLTQSVSMNPSMLNFLQQDPGQYAQPMMGNVNFTFDLFFDRSMELNNSGPNNTNIDNPWESGSPSQVGVLRDLGALYAVIGQGMAQFQTDYIVTAALKSAITVEANTATDAGDEDSATNGAEAISKIPEFLKNNMGNSAFLLPLPVRVVFSSLYIVEGLITDSTVVFTKFNTSYVPMQCAVSLTMEAKYIGFAKQKTFFTYVLEERNKEELRQAEVQGTTVTAFSNLVSSINMEVDEGVYGVDAQKKEFRIQARMPTAAAAQSSTSVTTIVPGRVGASTVTTEADPDGVSKMFNDGSLLGIEISATLSAYGPIPAANFNFPNATSDLLAFMVTRDFGVAGQKFQCSITPDDPGARASNTSEWKDMVDGAEGSDSRTDYPESTLLTGTYMVYHHSVTVTTTTGAGTVVGTGDVWVAVTGAWTASHNIPIVWPDSMLSSSNSSSGTVAPDNGASVVSRTLPGQGSQVGNDKIV